MRPAAIESFRLADAKPWSAEQSGIVNQTFMLLGLFQPTAQALEGPQQDALF